MSNIIGIGLFVVIVLFCFAASFIALCFFYSACSIQRDTDDHKEHHDA